MEVNDGILKLLNELLRDELTVINQYIVHSEMCNDWGYEKLYQAIEKQAIDNMFHAKWLIQRIIFLEGTPDVSNLNPMNIGKTVPDIVGNNLKAALSAIRSYSAAYALAHELANQAIIDLLFQIQKIEEEHVKWGENQRTQIKQIGLADYLAIQSHDGSKIN